MRGIVSYHHSRNEGDQDQSRIERHEGEAKIQEIMVYGGTTRAERQVYVGMTSIGQSVGVRCGEYRKVVVPDQLEMERDGEARDRRCDGRGSLEE
jgi:hypothetical protein